MNKYIRPETRIRTIISIIIALLLIFVLGYTAHLVKIGYSQKIKIIREPTAAGQFYPNNPDELNNIVNTYLNNAEKKDMSRVKGMISPYDEYIYSGQIAAEGYRQIYDNIRTVILLSSSHKIKFSGASVGNYTHYKTPLGEIKISDEVMELRKENIIVNDNEPHLKEYSLEAQLPFLQNRLNDFNIIPIIIGDVDPEELANILVDYIDEKTLVIASSDLSQYFNYKYAVQLDKVCTDAIPNLDFSEMNDCLASDKTAVLTLMYISKKMGWKGILIDYKNSGDVTGDERNVVGYTSIAFV